MSVGVGKELENGIFIQDKDFCMIGVHSAVLCVLWIFMYFLHVFLL